MHKFPEATLMLLQRQEKSEFAESQLFYSSSKLGDCVSFVSAKAHLHGSTLVFDGPTFVFNGPSLVFNCLLLLSELLGYFIQAIQNILKEDNKQCAHICDIAFGLMKVQLYILQHGLAKRDMWNNFMKST